MEKTHATAPEDVFALGRQRPRVAPWYRTEPVAGEGVYLIAERSEALLKGNVNLAVAPYLDGVRTTDEIVDELEGVLSPAEVYYAVTLAQREGYVTCEAPLPDAGAEAFWGGLGVSPADAERLLRAAPVRVSTLGNTDDGPVRAAFAELGIETSDDEGLEVVLVDDYLNPELASINEAALQSGRPWLPARLAGTLLWLGPVFEPGVSACWACMAQRIAANREVASYVSWRRGDAAPPIAPAPRLDSTAELGARLLALLVARRTVRLPEAGARLVTFDLLTFETQEHTVVARPQCPACGDPALAQETALPELRSHTRVPNFDGSRTVSPEMTVERYAHHISPLVGAITELVRTSDPSDPTTHVYLAGHNFAVRSRNLRYLKEGLRSKSSGKGTTDAQARASAICEALERYSGIFQGDEPRIRASFSRLGDDAIHPNAAMLFSQKQYAEQEAWLARNSRFAVVPLPFDEDDEVEWTRLWSLTHERWRYLPTGYLYYGYPHRPEQFYYWADSNGNAAGNVLEEAILQGFLELAERDAVCVWWYNRLRRPQLDLASFEDPWVDAVAERYEQVDRPVWVLDVTSDLGIPAFVALSARLDDPVEDILVACGAHLDARVALHRALGELNQFLPAVLPMRSDGSGEYAFPDPDCQDWWRSATRENQPYLVPHPELPARTATDFPALATDDLREDVLACRRLVEDRGLEMLVHDQTRPDLDLPVAKVVVPGLRHFWARFGPGRLYDVPVELGWLSEPLDERRLNPIPLFL